MKNKVIALLVVSVAIFCFVSCATFSEGEKDFGIHTALTERDYEVLGTVSLKSTVKSILGVYTWGGKGYADLLHEAKNLYPSTDVVIDISVDTNTRIYFGFYNEISKVYTATAIRFL